MLATLTADCGRRGDGGRGIETTGEGESTPQALTPLDAREREAWARAVRGDENDRIRLANLVGCTGLRERLAEPPWRATAIAAMGYCEDLSELPTLARVAASARDPDGVAALESIVEEAAQPRRSVDPEDDDALFAGCSALLALARADAPRARRVLAVRALRMLADRGCVHPAEIPTDLDAK